MPFCVEEAIYIYASLELTYQNSVLDSSKHVSRLKMHALLLSGKVAISVNRR